MSTPTKVYHEGLPADAEYARRPEDKIREVTRYAATDGTTFDTESDAVEYQYELDFKEWCIDSLPVDTNVDRIKVAREILGAWHLRRKP